MLNCVYDTHLISNSDQGNQKPCFLLTRIACYVIQFVHVCYSHRLAGVYGTISSTDQVHGIGSSLFEHHCEVFSCSRISLTVSSQDPLGFVNSLGIRATCSWNLTPLRSLSHEVQHGCQFVCDAVDLLPLKWTQMLKALDVFQEICLTETAENVSARRETCSTRNTKHFDNHIQLEKEVYAFCLFSQIKSCIFLPFLLAGVAHVSLYMSSVPLM